MQHHLPSSWAPPIPSTACPSDGRQLHAACWARVSDRTIVEHMPLVQQELHLVEHAMAKCGTTGAPAGYSGTRQSAIRGTNDPVSALLQCQDSQLHALQHHRELLLHWRDRFQQVCAAIPAWRDQLILRGCYGDGLKDSEIADMMKLTRHYVNRLRHRALEQLSQKPADPISPDIKPESAICERRSPE